MTSDCSARRRRAPCAVVAALALAMLLGACGASSKPTPSSAHVTKETCRQLEAVLSDGPEPAADPIGYAQAQILPLRQIHTTDAKLAEAIDTLASAYQGFSSSDGARSAKSAVSSASRAIDTICPAATS
jgi:hypothetical protein